MFTHSFGISASCVTLHAKMFPFAQHALSLASVLKACQGASCCKPVRQTAALTKVSGARGRRREQLLGEGYSLCVKPGQDATMLHGSTAGSCCACELQLVGSDRGKRPRLLFCYRRKRIRLMPRCHTCLSVRRWCNCTLPRGPHPGPPWALRRWANYCHYAECHYAQRHLNQRHRARRQSASRCRPAAAPGRQRDRGGPGHQRQQDGWVLLGGRHVWCVQPVSGTVDVPHMSTCNPCMHLVNNRRH